MLKETLLKVAEYFMKRVKILYRKDRQYFKSLSKRMFKLFRILRNGSN